MSESSLESLAGSRLMVGFEESEFTPGLARFLRQVRPAGIILFRRNVEGGPAQTARLVQACQNLALSEFDRPMLVAIDQEGGTVQRLPPPFTQLPSQRLMAETMGPEEVRALAGQSGRELSAVGLNLNLAPVLDIVTDPQASFMADRSFGADPEKAAELGLAVIAGHAEYDVLTCAKHFPGSGDTRIDPHQDLPVVEHSADRMRQMELIPFKRAIESGLAAVMSTHIRYPGLDPDQPATFSRKILTGLLREELGFSGLILTDDLEMGAVVKHYGLGEAAVLAVAAGCDLLLVCRRSDYVFEAREALLSAVRKGEVGQTVLAGTSLKLEALWPHLPRPSAEAFRKTFGHGW
ncbi:MAG: beta-N-acetylhexosaminidase [Pseudomonadota bacterium]